MPKRVRMELAVHRQVGARFITLTEGERLMWALMELLHAVRMDAQVL